jgi:hypothetical protein
MRRLCFIFVHYFLCGLVYTQLTNFIMAQVQQGDRAYLKKDGLFGDVKRMNLLNLQNSPVLLRDDNVLVGYVGDKVHDIVNKQTASDGNGTVQVPVDVRIIGIQLLTQFGVSQETQATMFTNFVGLPKEQRDVFVAAFDAVDQSKPDEVKTFLDNMVAGLTK